MKILILSKKFPYPLREGEPIAISYLSRSLKDLGCDISLLVLNTSKHYFDPAKFPPSENYFTNIYSIRVNNDISVAGAISSLIKGEPYILSRFYSKEFDDELARILQDGGFDVVQVETIYLAHYLPTIRKFSSAKIALRTHNVEHRIWEKVASETGNPLKKWYLQWQNKSLRTFELSMINECDILVAITKSDLNNFAAMGYKGTGLAAPVGMDLSNYVPSAHRYDQNGSIAFIGALDWIPNQLGVVWFLEHVWPKLKLKHPALSFHIAGKNTPDWIFNKSGHGVEVHGEVPDAKEFINQHPILIAPMFSGSGIKIKVLEGLALGRAVVTTTTGAEGIFANPGVHLEIADTPKAFFDSIDQLLLSHEKLDEMGKNGRAFIQRNFNNSEIAQEVLEAYRNVLTDHQ